MGPWLMWLLSVRLLNLVVFGPTQLADFGAVATLLELKGENATIQFSNDIFLTRRADTTPVRAAMSGGPLEIVEDDGTCGNCAVSFRQVSSICEDLVQTQINALQQDIIGTATHVILNGIILE